MEHASYFTWLLQYFLSQCHPEFYYTMISHPQSEALFLTECHNPIVIPTLILLGDTGDEAYCTGDPTQWGVASTISPQFLATDHAVWRWHMFWPFLPLFVQSFGASVGVKHGCNGRFFESLWWNNWRNTHAIWESLHGGAWEEWWDPKVDNLSNTTL